MPTPATKAATSGIEVKLVDTYQTEGRNVYQCIAAVSAVIARDGIAKDRNNAQQGYKFRGIDDVYNALAPMLARHGLVVIPRILSRSVTERVTQKGGVLFCVVVEAEFDFISAADGSKATVRTYGEAMDSGDKATNKAMSAAYKYAAFQTFCIPTEGDNDADKTTHTPAPSAPAGYVDWVIDLDLVAAEHGTEALQSTWQRSQAVLRKYQHDFDQATWDAIKAKAAAHDKAKLAAPPPPVQVDEKVVPF